MAGTWDCRDADANLTKGEGGGGDADVPAHTFPFIADVPDLAPRSSLCRSTWEEGSLVMGLLISDVPVTVV